VLVAIFVCATVYSIVTPLFVTDELDKTDEGRRPASVKAFARASALWPRPAVAAFASAETYMKNVVEKFSLSRVLAPEELEMKLASAGYRGPQAETAVSSSFA